MILVEPTEKNWEIFSQLCELDAEYRVRTSPEERADIVDLAQRLCDELEV